MKVTVGGGKYTVIITDNGRDFKALRYNEEWRDLCGDNLVMALAYELNELREWAIECRDTVLTPLACGESEMGRIAEGLGQSSVDLLKQ